MGRTEELLIQKRFTDLSRLADRRGMITYSNFLNLNELQLFYQVTADIATQYQLFGGYKYAERQMIVFIPDALSYALEDRGQDIFPIALLRFSPVHSKFAEELSHRDVLGALMHLGVERSHIGDIKIDGQNYFIFCEEGIADYLLDSLSQIRRTNVTGERVSAADFQIEQKFERLDGVVASERLDAILAFLTKKSRDKSAQFIQSQKVFVNERLAVSNAYHCRAEDVISIRGFGKYIYKGSSGETRKGRIRISVNKYL